MRASPGHLGITGKEEELWEEQEHMREKVFVTDPFTLVLNVITKRTHGRGGNYPFVTVNQNQSLPSRVTELKSGSANSCVFSPRDTFCSSSTMRNTGRDCRKRCRSEGIESEENIHQQTSVKCAFMSPSVCSVWLQLTEVSKISNKT